MIELQEVYRTYAMGGQLLHALHDVSETIEAGDYVDAQATLESALPTFERTSAVFLPVVQITKANEPPTLLGAIYHVDALRAYNRALAATAAEEHS